MNIIFCYCLLLNEETKIQNVICNMTFERFTTIIFTGTTHKSVRIQVSFISSFLTLTS